MNVELSILILSKANQNKYQMGTVPNENYDIIAVQSNFKLPSALSEPMFRKIYDSF